MPFAVNGADATPEPFVATVIVVVLLLNVPDAPDEGAVKVTFTPDNGLLPASFTVTARATPKDVSIAAVCGVVPALAVIEAGVPAVFVNEKLMVVSLLAAAVTVYGPPDVPFAVNGAEATPEAFVATVIVRVLLLKVPMFPWREP